MYLLSKFFGKLGRCQFCVRTAFLSALGGWIVTAATVQWHASLAWLPLVAASALTLLWLAHLVAFGLRVVHHREQTPEAAPLPGRRDFFRVFTRAVGFIAVASAVPALASVKCPDGFYPCGDHGVCCQNGRGCMGNGVCQ